MTSTLLSAVACLLAFWMGYSVNRASTCLVAAADEVRRRRRPRLLIGLLAASATAGLIAVPLAWSGLVDGRLAPSTGISIPLLVGAASFGIGALINDACLLGSLGRLGSGELRLISLPLGLAAGFLIIDRDMRGGATLCPSILAAPSLLGIVALAVFIIVIFLALRFISYRPPSRAGENRPLGISMLILGGAGGALYLIAPMWAYVNLVPHNRHSAMETGEIAILAVAASIGGSVTAALRQGQWRLRRPTSADIVRTFFGGALMGVGVALVPSGNDALILSAIPALSPGGIAAYLLMTATIVLGLAARAAIVRDRH